MNLKFIALITLLLSRTIIQTSDAMDNLEDESSTDDFIHLCSDITRPNVKKGVSWLPDDISMSHIFLVGAHNSPFSKERGWCYAQQLSGLTKQWDAGIRAFKTPIRYYQRYKNQSYDNYYMGAPEGEPQLVLTHETIKGNNSWTSRIQKGSITQNPSDCPLDYFKELKDLLDNNPSEVCIVILETHNMIPSEATNTSTYSDEKMKQDLRSLLTNSGLSTYACKLILTPGQNWPTLGNLRNSGKRLIIMSTNLKLDMELTNPSTLYCESDYKTYNINNINLRLEANKGKGIGEECFSILNNFDQASLWRNDFYQNINSHNHLMTRTKLYQKTYGRLGYQANICLLDYAEIGDATVVAQDINQERLNMLQEIIILRNIIDKINFNLDSDLDLSFYSILPLNQ